MDTVTLDRALACLDTMTPRHANQIARMVWPNRQFSTQQATGATIRSLLGELARRGLTQLGVQGWLRLGAPDDE